MFLFLMILGVDFENRAKKIKRVLNKRLNYLINFKIKLITSRIINTNHKYLGALTSLLLLILRLIPVKISAKERVD